MAYRLRFPSLDRYCRTRRNGHVVGMRCFCCCTAPLHDVALDQQIQRLCEEGRLERAVEVLLRLEDLGISPSSAEVYFCLLRACHKSKSLACALQIFQHITTKLVHFDFAAALADYLVITLAKCGGVREAHELFCALPRRTVFSWTAVISGYVDNGRAAEALVLQERMTDEGVEPTHFTLVSLLKACGSLRDLKQGQKLHLLAREKGVASNVYVANTLVGMYANCNSMVEAERIFGGSPSRDVVSWNVMLSAYLLEQQQQGLQLSKKALNLFRQMQDERVAPDERTFVLILQVCSAMADVDQSAEGGALAEMVRGCHVDIDRCPGFFSNVFVSNSLMCAYGKCGMIKEAEMVFSAVLLPEHNNVVTWNAMLSTYTVRQEHGRRALRFFKFMHEQGVQPNERTFVSALRACNHLCTDEDSEEDPVTGISQIMELGGTPSLRTVSQEITQALHVDICRRGFSSDPFVISTLVTSYSKLGMLAEAENAFSAVSHCTLILWCAMLSAYSDQGHGEEALRLLSKMQAKGVVLDKTALLISLQACCTLAAEECTVALDGMPKRLLALNIGQVLHADAVAQGHGSDVSISTVLISLYSKSGSSAEAERIFDRMTQPDAISCTAMLMAFLDQGQNEKALYLYDKLLKDRHTMDDMLLVCVLQACRETGSLGTFWHLYFSVVSTGYESIPCLASCVMDTCQGDMADSQAILDQLTRPDLVFWSACVAGHASRGDFVACLKNVEEMQMMGIRPDEVVILSLLTVCSHSGQVHRGLQYFVVVLLSPAFDLVPDIKHYVTMADLLGRAGDFRRLEDMVCNARMPAAEADDVSIWLCLLGACATHNNVEVGKVAFNRAIAVQPNAQTAYVLMSNVCTTDVVTEIF